MKKVFYKGRFIFIPLGAAAFLVLIGLVVMQLWNNLLPDLLHVGLISFWQAIGLFILCKILFGFGRGGRIGGAPWMRKRMEERFKNMSPEEKENFKAKMSNRMRGFRDKSWKRHDWQQEPAVENPVQPGI